MQYRYNLYNMELRWFMKTGTISWCISSHYFLDLRSLRIPSLVGSRLLVRAWKWIPSSVFLSRSSWESLVARDRVSLSARCRSVVASPNNTWLVSSPYRLLNSIIVLQFSMRRWDIGVISIKRRRINIWFIFAYSQQSLMYFLGAELSDVVRSLSRDFST